MKYVKIGDIAELIRGVSYKKSDASNANCDKSTAILRANNIVNGSFELSELVYVPKELVKEEQYINKNDIMITMSSGSKAHVGKVAIAVSDMNYAFGAFCGKIVVKKDVVPKFLYYLLINGRFRSHIEKQCKGTNINNLKKDYILNYEFDLPSIHNQHRIVTRIEELFSQLDSGVETLKKTKEQLKVYRQAVLKEAFEGRYSSINHFDITSTKVDYDRIRKENAVFKDVSGDDNELQIELPDDALLIRFGNVFDVEVGATPKRSVPEYWNGNINWVSSGEVKFQSINNTEEMITENGLQNSSTNVQPIGTVLLAMIGEGKTRGQAAILNIPAAHNQNTAAILVSKTPCNPKYIYHYLNLSYENTRRVGSGNNQKALNKERVRAIRFPFVSFEKQNIIVKEIESRLSVCDSIEKTIDTALQEAEALRQSILKQAFEGGL